MGCFSPLGFIIYIIIYIYSYISVLSDSLSGTSCPWSFFLVPWGHDDVSSFGCAACLVCQSHACLFCTA